MLDLNGEKVRDLSGELEREYDVDAPFYAVDITTSSGRCGQQILDRYHNLHGLVNNAANNPKVESNSEFDFHV